MALFNDVLRLRRAEVEIDFVVFVEFLRSERVRLVNLSRHESAARFGIAPSTVINWVRRVQETGSVAPGRMGGQKPKAIAGEHALFLSRRVREGAFTLRGLVVELAERGLKVDYRSVWNFVHAEKLSFKKNRSRQRARST